MSNSWPVVRVGEVVRYKKEFVTIDDLVTYKRPRVRLHAQGIVFRDEIPGALIKTKKQQVCRLGQFLVAEIDAKVGGFGIVPSSLDGAIVSSHYFLFDVDESKLDRCFLDYFTRTPRFREQIEAQGSTNYAAIRPGQVLDYEIPLPHLAEQRRIVARIDELASHINEACALRKQTSQESRALLTAWRRVLIGDKHAKGWIPLSTFVAELENGKSPSCEPRSAEHQEWGILKVGAVSFGYFDERQNKALPADLVADQRFEVTAGDFLMSRANTSELVGACVVIENTRPRLLLSDKLFRFHFKEGIHLSPHWLNHVMKSPALREQIVKGATGTSPTMKNISKEKVFGLLVPSHDLARQKRIATEMSKLEKEAAALNRLQHESSSELDALLPSIVDRAFKGEL